MIEKNFEIELMMMETDTLMIIFDGILKRNQMILHQFEVTEL
jgi:hypothetical protein